MFRVKWRPAEGDLAFVDAARVQVQVLKHHLVDSAAEEELERESDN